MTDNTQLRTLLQEQLRPYTTFSHHRLTLLTYLLSALIELATVNLAKIALLLPAKPTSSYRRLQRFFAQAKLPQRATAAFLLHLLPYCRSGKSQHLIAVDRTDWHFGRTPINLLVASLVFDGAAFPLVWIVLGKSGSCHRAEQRAVLRKLFLVVPARQIRAVLADREFVSEAFAAYLTHHGVGYGIRIRKNAQVAYRGGTTRAEALFSDLAVGQHRRLRARRCIYGQMVWLYGLRLPDGPKRERRLLLVAGTVRRLLHLYRLRWGIEVLFAGLKSRGFDVERTHLRQSERLSLLMGVLALAYGLAHATGRYVSEQHPIRLKTPGRRARSVFRLGLDRLRRVLLLGLQEAWSELVSLFRTGALGTASPPS